MDLGLIFSRDLTTWVIIPALIFLARVMDVSIGTIRVIYVAKGVRALAPLLGFIEVLIWLLAISQILQNLTHWLNYIAYAAGFAMGNFVGMAIETRLALGTVILRLITSSDASELLLALRRGNYGVTSINAEGKFGPVKVLFMLAARKELPKIIGLVNRYNPKAFYSVEDIRFVSEGIFPAKQKLALLPGIDVRRLFSKVK